MQLHELKPTHKNKDKKRIGRGGKRGTYSGRGQKGQKSRSGSNRQPIIRKMIKKYPKLRGYKFKAVKTDLAIINLDILEKNFKAQEKVSPKSLLEKKIIGKIKKQTRKVKILGRGEISKALSFENCEISNKAKEKIEKVGGKIEKIEKIEKTEKIEKNNKK